MSLLTLLSNQTAPAVTTKAWIRVAGVWRLATVWVKVAGTWKVARPLVKIGGVWK